MVRKGYALLFTLAVLISSALAESFTPPADIVFDIEINKKGTQQLYFANPDNYAEPYMNARAFPLASGEAQAFEIRLGVVWSLFPELESTHDTVGIDIRLQASSVSEYESGTQNRYMMDLITASGLAVPGGLNYSIHVYDVDYSSGSISQTSNDEASIQIEDSEITRQLSYSERTRSLFKGVVDAGGTMGKKRLVLVLTPPKDPANDGVYYMEGDYEGYLILHVETY